MKISQKINALCLVCLGFCVSTLHAEQNHSSTVKLDETKIVIVTIDGLRWQEVFSGADELLIKDEKLVRNVPRLMEAFWSPDKQVRRNKLMPFFTQFINQQGILIGDFSQAESVTLANNYYFSYPGYLEIYSGKVDDSIVSNEKLETNTPNILELLQNKYEYRNNIGVFASWDVFPYILRRGKHQVFINSGFEPLDVDAAKIQNIEAKANINQINTLFRNTPSPWETVRLDAFTHAYAMHYLKQVKPRVMAISYGDTDDFAHDGRYDEYLRAIQRSDTFVRELWEYLQSEPYYKNQTYVLITTDHGRGALPEDWRHHASKTAIQGYMGSLEGFPEGIVGSNRVWIGAIGPEIKQLSAPIVTPIKLTQFASTALHLLGECELAEDLHAPILEIMETHRCK